MSCGSRQNIYLERGKSKTNLYCYKQDVTTDARSSSKFICIAVDKQLTKFSKLLFAR
jgi:hypothetical protein